ncbi:DUF3293 domain-containing protein [Photobacterium atrarenae]|uniref:DUF3293 domain-containing protein n=1 Tax=Photobacterium atrarenae TaxID=865757 RepID=A0ABY5GDX4_9GAMM|nr:DUF3293 domain-containing protein [Photobacterium atrarenae]UTV27315.1 DUF3293 domain-containing protein [Photobacterium atrarenae]
MCEHISLWCCYQTIQFKAGQRPVYPYFAILTAFNPGSIVLPPAQNRKRNTLLKNELLHEINGLQPLDCSAPDGSWLEPSFAVPVSRARAAQLARRWGQNAFYWVEQGKLYLEPVQIDAVTTIKLGDFKDFFYTE